MIVETPLVIFFGLLILPPFPECNVVRTIPVRLINEAAVKSKVLIEAQREAAWALESLCVEVEWAQKPSTNSLVMYIVVKPFSQGATQRALGVASLDVERASRGAVFLSRIRSLEKLHEPMISLGTLLGYVLAHEIGHLLLNSRAHSPEGIMIANFGTDQVLSASQRRLKFTAADREKFLKTQIARHF